MQCYYVEERNMAQRWMRIGSDSDSLASWFNSSSWLLRSLRKYWFLLAICLSILLADRLPGLGRTGGPLHPEVTVKYIAVSLIFFNSGLSLKSKDLLDALLYAKLHLYVQGFSLLFIPIFMEFLVHVFRAVGFLSEELLQGLLVLGCMPTPVGTAVILTKAAGGNEAAAVFNSAFGSALGVLVTPLMILNFLGSSVSMSLGTIVGKLAITVILPVAVGQIVRIMTAERLSFLLPHLNFINSISLLLIIFSTFSDTFYSGTYSLDTLHVIIVVFVVCILHTAMLYCSFVLSQVRPFSFTPSDVVAVTFSSTQKSLTLGIPMLKIIFPDVARQSLLAIPLLVQEPVQILIGGFIVTSFKAWLQRPKSEWSNSPSSSVLIDNKNNEAVNKSLLNDSSDDSVSADNNKISYPILHREGVDKRNESTADHLHKTDVTSSETVDGAVMSV